jgi:hypothetical protein
MQILWKIDTFLRLQVDGASVVYVCSFIMMKVVVKMHG